MKKTLRSLGLVLVVSSTQAFGYDFAEANRLFSMRGDGIEAVRQAVAAFEAAFSAQLSDDETVYAAENLSRLHAYRANLIPRTSMGERVPHYDSCVAAATRMQSVSQRQPTPQYFFWFGACKMLWAEAKGVETALRNSKVVVEAMNRGRSLDSTYEGGGFDRVLGAMYAKLPIFNPWGPGGNLNKGLQHLQAAISSPAYGGAENPETATGEYFYESYWYYAQALESAGRKAEAISQLEAALQRIEDGEISETRRPETALVEELLRDQLAKLKP